jgi:enoyl-CoA hydratase/carnithine racemase
MLTEKKGNIGYIFFDEPDNIKYYDDPAEKITVEPPEKHGGEFDNPFSEMDADKDVRVIILSGKNDKFSGGGKVPGYPDGPLMVQRAFGERGIKWLQTIYGLSKPIIAAVNGHALAGGVMFTVACDLAVAGRDCMFGLPELQRGYFPMLAMAVLQKEMPKKRFFELAFTNKLVTAGTMLQWNLINKVVDQDRVMEAAEEMAREIASYSAVPITFGRQCFYKMMNMNSMNALEYSASQLVNMMWTDDVRETARAAIENRPPRYTGQ